MKKIIYLMLFLCPLVSFGQENGQSSYLFDDFTTGRAYLVRGGYSENLLNYDLAGERFLFLQDGEVLVLSNADDFSSIVIGERVFVPAREGAFRERILLPDAKSYYIRWWADVRSKGKPAGYGGVSQTAAIDTYGSLHADGQVRNLVSGEQFEIKLRNVYSVTVDGKEKNYTTLRSLTNIFRQHKSEIEEFVDRENINFSKPADVQRIMEFCAPFM